MQQKFVSEVFYNEKEKIYDFKNREVDQFEYQKYYNVQGYLTRYLGEEIRLEAERLFRNYCGDFWCKNIITQTIPCCIINYLNEQKDFWNNEYNLLYDGNQKNKNMKKQKKLLKNEKTKKINLELNIPRGKILKHINKSQNDNLIKTCIDKLNSTWEKLKPIKKDSKILYFENKCLKLKDFIYDFNLKK